MLEYLLLVTTRCFKPCKCEQKHLLGIPAGHQDSEETIRRAIIATIQQQDAVVIKIERQQPQGTFDEYQGDTL